MLRRNLDFATDDITQKSNTDFEFARVFTEAKDIEWFLH